jgi:acylphosphatase
MVKQLKVNIKGKVQGVFFRKSILEKAKELDIKGKVRNEASGDVYMEAVGEESALEALLAFCKEGPPAAQVDEVLVEEHDQLTERYDDFQIEY